MPTRQMRRRERSAARRAAFHTERIQRASTPGERLEAAAAYLVSAAAHARGAGAAREAANEIAEQARQAIEKAGMSPASRRLHEEKLRRGGPEVARLSSVLMVLRSALAQLPEPERDRLQDFYVEQLTAEARRIGGGG